MGVGFKHVDCQTCRCLRAVTGGALIGSMHSHPSSIASDSSKALAPPVSVPVRSILTGCVKALQQGEALEVGKVV